MTRVTNGREVLALACALLLGGCSARGGGVSASVARHDEGVRLSPDPAYAAARIAVVLDDPRLNASRCRFEWRRNGMLISDVSSDGLDPSRFSRGDRIAVAVSAPDPASGVVRTLNASVEVQNSPPKITRASLVLATDAGTSVLQASVESSDPDGDVPAYSYRWWRNDAPLEGATGSSVPLSKLTRGDRLVVEVTARDGESSSTPLRSEPFRFEDQPPHFTSQPAAPRPTDDAFHYQAMAIDGDGDPLKYELVSGPDGMTVSAAGEVDWPLAPREMRHGSFPVRIRVSDSKGGEATQDFTLNLDPPAPKP